MKEGPFTTRAPLSLEERFDLLLRENAVLRSQLYWAEHGLKWSDPDVRTSWQARKIERQRLAIQRLQWKGWEADYVIEEAC